MNTIPDKDPSLRDLLRILDRRKRLIYKTAAVVFLLAVLACIVTTRRYTSSGVIQLQKTSSDTVNIDSLTGTEDVADSLSLNTDLQTQSDILKSEGLALRVIQELNLEQNEDFKPKFNLIGWLVNLIPGPAGTPDPAQASLENSPNRRLRVLKVFSKQLQVKIKAGTRLIEIDYTNRDPKVAAEVVNHLIQALMEYSFQTRQIATNQVSQGLEAQLSDLRKHSEDLQSQVVKLQQGSLLFGTGVPDSTGGTSLNSPVLQNLNKSTEQLSQATMNRVLKQAVYDVVRTGDPEAISQLSGTQVAGEGGQGVNGSLNLIQTLRGQESTLQAQIGQESTKFGPAYPRLIQDQASLKAVQQSMKDEIERIRVRAKTDYDVAMQAEAGAQAAYNNDRGAAEKLNDKGVQIGILSREADQSQTLYQDLLKRLKEAGIVEGLHSSNIAVVDSATPSAKPAKPNVPLYLVLGVVLGFFFGAVGALLVDSLDDKIQGIEQIEAMGLPVLGLVPQIEMDGTTPGALLLDSGYSIFGEAVRGLRSTLLESHTGRQVQVLLVTSSGPREGKSSLALNLAVSQAQFNKKVLLVEADMRRPVLRKILGLGGLDGLSDLLANPSSTVSPHLLPNYRDLHCLPAGTVPGHPAELLGSERMQSLMREWRRDYDFIVLDCPPVLPVTDAQYLEGMADATFLVARTGQTSKIALQRAYDLLLRHVKDPHNPRIGVVLNFISPRSATYYGYYGYKGNLDHEYEKVGSSGRG